MASILKRVFRIFNGTDWDAVHFETDSEQVKHDTTTVKAKLDALKSGALATVVNNLTTTAANTVLDGRQGKALNDKITAINSALVYVNTADVKDGSNFNKNFLNIGTAAQSEKTQRSLFLIEADTADQWASVPPGLVTTSVSVGIREVFWYSSTVVMVRVTEIHPKPGTMYMRTYNNGSWNDGGWKTITPQ